MAKLKLDVVFKKYIDSLVPKIQYEKNSDFSKTSIDFHAKLSRICAKMDIS